MAIRASMNVSVTPELERFVRHLVTTGRYQSVSEVFREGLRLLEQEERRRLVEKWLVRGLTTEEHATLSIDDVTRVRHDLERQIRAGLDALRRGEVVDGETWFERYHAGKPAREPLRRSRAK